MTLTIHLRILPDGSVMNDGRHGPNRSGPTQVYRGEAAEVMRLVLQYCEGRKG